MIKIYRQDNWYSVWLDGVELGRFIFLVDAHCFGMQLIERGMAETLRLYSGQIVKF